MKKRIGIRMVLMMICILLLGGAFCAGNYISCLAEGSNKTALPIIMYHHILQDKGKQGTFVISPKELEQDLLYLKENGYTAIGTKELLAFQEDGIPLPEKPVMLTFDDGYLSYLEYAVPLLSQYGMKAVVSVVGAYSDIYTETVDRNVSYACLNWEDISKLSESEHTEIMHHTYDMHKNAGGRKGCARMKGEEKEVYRKAFREDTEKMQNLLEIHTGKKAPCFTYPFGFYCGESEEELKSMGFSMSLCCEEGINYLSRDSALFKLKRFNRKHGRSVEEILKKCS